MIILFICFDACAGVSLVLPVYTKHIGANECEEGSMRAACSDGFEYNDDNYGAGAEYSFNENHAIGAIYVKKDSYDNENFYFYYSRGFKLRGDFTLAVSLYVPTNYEGLSIKPLFSVQYKIIRVGTSYPVAQIADGRVDIINVHLVIPLNF